MKGAVKIEAGSSSEQTHILAVVQRLQEDLQALSKRLDSLETRKVTNMGSEVPSAKPKRSTVEQVGSLAATYSSLPQVVPLSLPEWFPFKGVSLGTVLFILGWPFVAQYILAKLRHRKNV